MKLLIVVALGLLPFIAAYDMTGEAIRSGFMVKLEVNKTLENLPNNITRYDCLVCSGVFVAKRWILTAANCIFNANFVIAYVINQKGKCKGGNIIHNRYFYIHPRFREFPLSNNVALIMFRRKRDCGNIQPVMLPSYKHNRPHYKRMYGIYVKLGNACTGHVADPSYAYLQVVSRKVCQKNPLLKNISPKYLCVDVGDYHFSCNGDVAGPLLTRHTGELIGIMSTVRGFCRSGRPIVFTRIARYTRWISSTVAWSYFITLSEIKLLLH